MAVELHCHSLFSVDAACTPEEMVDVAAALGLSALAITDHNSIGSLKRAREQAEARSLRYINGVEMSGMWKDHHYHLVCLGFDPENEELIKVIEYSHSTYDVNARMMLKALRGKGYSVTDEELADWCARRYPTHPSPITSYYALRDTLVERGDFPNAEASAEVVQAVQRRLSEEGAFQQMLPLEKVRDAAHDAGGVVLLAHVAYDWPGNKEFQLALIREMMENDLDGFELYHQCNMAEPHFGDFVVEAERLGCAVSGGSDCHNAKDPDSPYPLDACKVPDWVLTTIDAALARQRGD